MRLNKLLNAVAGAGLFASIVGCSDSIFKSGAGSAVSPAPSQQIPAFAKPLPPGPLEPKPCLQTTLPAVPEKLDFESIPNPSEGLVIDNVLNAYLKGAYGISFVAKQGGALKLAKIKNQNDTDATFDAWKSLLCPGLPNHNRLCEGGNAGQWILSVANVMSTDVIEFDAVYDSPANRVEFDLADFDGDESWTITPYNSTGAVIPGARTFNAANGYGGATGNNALTHLTITTSDTNISRIKFKGTKSINIFGFGFDNFTTGITYCPK